MEMQIASQSVHIITFLSSLENSDVVQPSWNTDRITAWHCQNGLIGLQNIITAHRGDNRNTTIPSETLQLKAISSVNTALSKNLNGSCSTTTLIVEHNLLRSLLRLVLKEELQLGSASFFGKIHAEHDKIICTVPTGLKKQFTTLTMSNWLLSGHGERRNGHTTVLLA